VAAGEKSREQEPNDLVLTNEHRGDLLLERLTACPKPRQCFLCRFDFVIHKKLQFPKKRKADGCLLTAFPAAVNNHALNFSFAAFLQNILSLYLLERNMDRQCDGRIASIQNSHTTIARTKSYRCILNLRPKYFQPHKIDRKRIGKELKTLF
jgi:hypothetical protein